MGMGPRAIRSARVGPSTSFHDDGALFHTVDCGDVGVIQQRQHLGFPLEARHAVGIGGEGIGKNLNGDLPRKLGIGGATPRPYRLRRA